MVSRVPPLPSVKDSPPHSGTSHGATLIRHWIPRFGVPDDITSDRGPQFTSHMWSELNQLLGISSSNTTAYRPQANGLVERFHRQLKGSLKARLQGPRWMDELPLVLLGIRTAWREDPGCSASDLVYGTSLRIPGEFSNETCECPPSFSANSKTICVPSFHPHMCSTAVAQPTRLTASHPLAMCTFAMMPTANRCSARMTAHSRSWRLMRSTMCLT